MPTASTTKRSFFDAPAEARTFDGTAFYSPDEECALLRILQSLPHVKQTDGGMHSDDLRQALEARDLVIETAFLLQCLQHLEKLKLVISLSIHAGNLMHYTWCKTDERYKAYA